MRILKSMFFKRRDRSALVEKDISGMNFTDAFRFFRNDSEDATFDPSTNKALLQSYKANALVYSCIKLKSQAFQQPPLALQMLDPKTDEWKDDLKSSLREPFISNPFLSESEIKQYISIHLNCTGKSFLWKWKNNMNEVVEVWPLPPHWVQVQTADSIDPSTGKATLISGYIITTDSGKQFTLLEDDVIYTRYIDPMNLWDGFGPLQAAWKNVQTDDKALLRQAEGITSSNVPSVIIKTMKPLNPTQKLDLRTILAQKMGSSVRGNILTVNGADVDVTITEALKGYDWKTINDMDEARICMVFGIPPVVVGAVVGLENSPWSNIKEAQRWFYTSTMLYEWEMVATSVSRDLIPAKQRGTMRYAFDTSNVQAMQDDYTVTLERALKIWNDGLGTRNECRALLGMNDDAEAGEVYKYKMQDVLIQREDTDMSLDDHMSGATGESAGSV